MLEKDIEKLYNDAMKQVVYPLVGRDATYDIHLNKAGIKLFGAKFRGVFASDKIPKLNDIVPYAILNVDKSNQPGSHWVSVAKHKDKLYFYDSFGRRASELMPSIIKSKNGTVIDSDLDKEQTEQEENCGARSLAWLFIFHTYGPEAAKQI